MALVNGLVMGGGAAMVAPLKFAVVTEKTVCINSTPYRPIIYKLIQLKFSVCIYFNESS